jgi:RND family efflux transporter MFP subunit
MRIVVDLAEAFIPSITVGDLVTVHFTEIADSMVTKITTVAKTVNPLSRTFRVEIPLTSVPKDLRPNTTCRVVVNDVTIPDALVLPLSAVLHDNTGSYAYVVDAKGTVRRRTLTTGLTSGGSIQVLTGVQSGEKVITRGATDVADGQVVRVVN